MKNVNMTHFTVSVEFTFICFLGHLVKASYELSLSVKVSFVRVLGKMRLVHLILVCVAHIFALEVPDFEVFDNEGYNGDEGTKCAKTFSATSVSLSKLHNQEK